MLAPLLASSPALAQICEAQETQEALGYLRRLSLDLRNEVPSLPELETTAQTGGVDPALIDSMINAESMVERLREYHRALLWANIRSQDLTNNRFELSTFRGAQGPVYYVNNRASSYRRAYNLPCRDAPAEFGPDGEILTQPYAGTRVEFEGGVQEGWVEVQPYWAPDTTVRVCAFDAQTQTPTAPNPIDAGQPAIPLCAISARANQRECGCGENLRWCQSRVDGTQELIVDSFSEQLLRFVDGIVRDDRPYWEILLSKEVKLNGPLSHYLQHQIWTSLGTFSVLPDNGVNLVDIPFSETSTWRTTQRSEVHSGVLTLPAFLLRFNTNRARATRFYESFLCVNFAPPPGGLPNADDPCNTETDLRKRCGCNFCHVTLEPAAAHWGRWAESGFAPLPEQTFPRTREDCAGNRQDPICGAFYITEATLPEEEPFVGELRAYLYADQTLENNIDQGPTAFAQQAVDNGTFATCTTRNLWSMLMGREANEQDTPAIDELAARFQTEHGYKLRALIQDIVRRQEYIRGERFKEEN